jgi:hypothetical protein
MTLTIPRSRQVAILANMTALALLGNYALVGIPSVEIGSVVIFITSLLFGLSMGMSCALLTSIIFAAFNPWGPFIPQIWIAQVIGWMYIAAVGGLPKPKQPDLYQGRTKMFIAGAYLTLVFDLVTNMGYAIVFNVPYILANIIGLPFMIVHVISNAIIMALVVPKIEPILKSDLASMIWVSENTELGTETVELLEEGI